MRRTIVTTLCALLVPASAATAAPSADPGDGVPWAVAAPRQVGMTAWPATARAAALARRAAPRARRASRGARTRRPPTAVTAGDRVARSRAIGWPWRGRLVNGVQLPEQSEHHFTWDWGLDRSPNRPWRRWGTDVLVAWVRAVVAGYRAENPGAPRVGIADLSRPRGGDFGPEVAGGLGHASHQNGLDVDILYPRRDGRELVPLRAAQVDRRLAQALVDAFVRAGAERAFVGHGVRLTGPRGVVSALPHHDDHVHLRISKRALQLWAAPLGVR